MNTYKITDLYITAYLKALGFDCEMETQQKRCYFIFPEQARDCVAELMRNTNKTNFNVNAIMLINEVKQLKAYVNNI